MTILPVQRQSCFAESEAVQSVKTALNVETGCLRTASGDSVLSARALGSCVAVLVWDSVRRCGGLAHILLPGHPGRTEAGERRRYAGPAITDLLARMRSRRSDPVSWRIFLIGGGNVLRKSDDTICSENILSVRQILRAKGLRPVREVLGGTTWKNVSLCVATGCVRYRIGQEKQKIVRLEEGL